MICHPTIYGSSRTGDTEADFGFRRIHGALENAAVLMVGSWLVLCSPNLNMCVCVSCRYHLISINIMIFLRSLQ